MPRISPLTPHLPSIPSSSARGSSISGSSDASKTTLLPRGQSTCTISLSQLSPPAVCFKDKERSESSLKEELVSCISVSGEPLERDSLASKKQDNSRQRIRAV